MPAWVGGLVFTASLAATALFSNSLYAQKFSCKEECEAYRFDRGVIYENCIKKAEAIPDRMAGIAQKRYCRDRMEVIECDGLPACQKGQKPASGPANSAAPVNPPVSAQPDLKMQNLTLTALQTRKGQKTGIFYPQQTIWARYEVVAAAMQSEKRLWLDQEIVVLDAGGNELLRDSNTFERELGLSREFSFKASFNVPENFAPGHYQFKIRLREKLSAWQGELQQKFEIRK